MFTEPSSLIDVARMARLSYHGLTLYCTNVQDVIPAKAHGRQLKENVTPWLDHGAHKNNLQRTLF